MKHFPSFATIEPKPARVLLILLHVPVLAAMYAIHLAGCTVKFMGDYATDIVRLAGNAATGFTIVSSNNFEELANNVFTGGINLLRDVALVYRGVASGNVAAAIPAMMQTAHDSAVELNAAEHAWHEVHAAIAEVHTVDAPSEHTGFPDITDQHVAPVVVPSA